MNTFYDLIGRGDWFQKDQRVRGLFDTDLFFWMYRENERKVDAEARNVTLSPYCWVGNECTRILRCSTEYQLFEAKLRFGEVFTRYIVTEQQLDISQFICTDNIRFK